MMTVSYDKLFFLMEERNINNAFLMRKANISGNIMSRLKHNQYVSLETVESICYVLQCSIGDILKFTFPDISECGYKEIEDTKTKIMSIQNRRYLGNKFNLIDFIRQVTDEHCSDIESIADIFAGTGAVSSAFIDRAIVTNDLLYSNYLCNLAWFGSETIRPNFLKGLIEEYNRKSNLEDNYMTENFSDTYFSRNDCTKIGFIREDIENKYQNEVISERERAILIASLLYAMDRIANTCGHYDAYRRGVIFDRHLLLSPLDVPIRNSLKNRCFNEDANELVKHIKADLIYIDPPYNSRQYCDTYHLLENVARWQKPPVHGVARKMDRQGLKSDYCTSKAASAFEDLILNIDAKYILFSYNNMATKGDDRSNARISDDDIFRILETKGKVEVFSKKYKAFSTGKSDIQGNEERLFLCKVGQKV